MATLGMCFDRSYPAALIGPYARDLESAGLDECWVIEDCFFTAGVGLAAAALTATDHLGVGIGILPAVARNPAITAMEIATLAGLAPGRLTAGIGHGVQAWMAQIGARTPSPLTTLDETITAVRRLLAGEEVSMDGREVRLDRVRLDRPPAVVPRVVAGVAQERSLALAGRVADGVVLGEGAGPAYVTWALEQAGRPRPGERDPSGGFHVVTYTILAVERDRRAAYRHVADVVAAMVREGRPSFRVLPFHDELRRRVERGGPSALLDMPADHWREIGAVGTLDDAAAHLDALDAAGVASVNVFPGPDPADAAAVLPVVAELARR